MSGNWIVVNTKLSNEEYEKFKKLRELLVKLGVIESNSDYRAFRFCIFFTMEAMSRAIDVAMNENMAR